MTALTSLQNQGRRPPVSGLSCRSAAIGLADRRRQPLVKTPIPLASLSRFQALLECPGSRP